MRSMIHAVRRRSGCTTAARADCRVLLLLPLCCGLAPVDGVVVARGERAAVAAVCSAGQFGLLVAADPAAEPWAGGWQATGAIDHVRESWRWSEQAPERWSLWYRLEGETSAWSVPNPRSHMARVVARSAGDLFWQLWLPGDDPSAPGRRIPAPVAAVARMWLLAAAS